MWIIVMIYMPVTQHTLLETNAQLHFSIAQTGITDRYWNVFCDTA